MNKTSTWFTIDIEKLSDTNFDIKQKKDLILNYEQLIDNWLEFCSNNSARSTGFILGSFAQEFPQIVKKFHSHNHEIACHGLNHQLVYKIEFSKWKQETQDAKKILEDLIGSEVKGYRSPSWSLPFEEKYYEALLEIGFEYSSSYFPFKTYMYGNSIDKKEPFDAWGVKEIPIGKNIIPFSGGFYLRVLPNFVQKILMKNLKQKVIYIHPYELLETNLIPFYKDYFEFNKDFFLAFFSTSKPLKKLEIYV